MKRRKWRRQRRRRRREKRSSEKANKLESSVFKEKGSGGKSEVKGGEEKRNGVLRLRISLRVQCLKRKEAEEKETAKEEKRRGGEF